MVHLYVKSAFGLVVAWIIYAHVRNWLRWRALKKWGDKFGCGEAPTAPNILPGGIERYYRIFKLAKVPGFDFLEDFTRKHFNLMGVNTYRIHNTFYQSVVTTAEPENIQAILATKFQDFDLGPARNDAFHEMLGNGIFTAEREAWAHYRHILKPQFTRDQVSDLEAADRHLKVLFKALPSENALGWIEEADLMPLLYRFTLDVSTEFLFGQSVNSQTTALHAQDSGNTAEMQANIEFSDAMTTAQECISWRIRLRYLAYLPIPKEFRRACNTVKSFADHFVQIALDPNHKRHVAINGEKQKYILLDELVAETRDPIELRDQALQILLAGRDTTSALLSWTILLLARHPEEFTRLRSVIVSHFGTETNPTNELTFSSLKACKELTHVLYETLRLYPLVPLNGRLATKNTILPTGGGPDRKQPIAIMKGEQVGYAAYVMHRRKDIWGEDADEFRPRRWEGRKLGWEMIAFSGGPRICLGQQYALNEASFVMVKVLQRFDMLEALDMTGPLKKAITITLSPENGVKVKMHRASS